MKFWENSFFLFILFLFPFFLWGQNQLFEKDILFFNPSGLESVTNHRLAFGDLDGDLDLDLVIGEYHGRLIFYRNIGSITNPIWKQDLEVLSNIHIPPISGPPYSAPFLVDLDNDGDLDLVVGVRGSSTLNDLYFFRNIGTKYKPAWQEDASVFQISEGELAVPAFADLDNDGDYDLVLGDVDGSLHYYRNTGTPSNPVWEEDVNFFLAPTYIDVGINSSPTLGDLDGDGDFDLLVGGGDGKIYYFENTGTKTDPKFTPVEDFLADIDVGQNSAPTLVDINGDGLLDLYIGNWLNLLSFYQNTGTRTHPQFTEIPDYVDGIDVGLNSAPAPVDLNDDGKPDIVVGNRNDSKKLPLITLMNQGTIQAPVWVRDETAFPDLDTYLDRYTTPFFVDLDDDGDKDLVVGGWEGRLAYFENTGTKQNPQWTFNPMLFLGIDVGNYSVPFFADLDDDGDYDLILGEDIGELTYFPNEGTKSNPVFYSDEPDTNLFANIDVGARSAPALLDLDGDGDLDLIVAEGSVTGGKLFYYQNSGDKKHPIWTYIENYFQDFDFDLDYFPVPRVFDMNDDGAVDLVIGEQSGTLKIYWNTSGFALKSGPQFSDFSPTEVIDTTRFYIQGVIKDPQGVYDDNTGSDGQGVYLLWDTDGELTNSSVETQMEKISGDTFRTVVPFSSQPWNSEFVYQVYAYDNDPTGRTQGVSALMRINIVDDDVTGPQFLYILPDTVNPETPFNVECSLQDISGIYDDTTASNGQGAYLRWDTDGEVENTFNELAMMKISNTRLRTIEPIPGQPEGTNVIVKIYVHDNDYDNNLAMDRMQSISGTHFIKITTGAGTGDDDITGPEISNIVTVPKTVYDTTSFYIRASITDPSGVYDDQTGSSGQGIYLLWDTDGELQQTSNEITMSSIGNNIYQTDTPIPSQFWGANFVFRIFAYDNDFDNADPNDRALTMTPIQTVTILDDDSEGPIFQLITPPNIVENQPFYIKAVITDLSGIYDDNTGSDGQGVYLSYDVDGELSVTSNEITMHRLSQDTFIVDSPIPGQPGGTQLLFRIFAHDNDFDNNIAADRAEATSQIRTVVIYQSGDQDVQGPEFVEGSWRPSVVYDDQIFKISGEIRDPSGVFDDQSGSDGQGVYLLWDTDGELARNANEIQLDRVQGDLFQTVDYLPSQPAGIEILYQVFAYDDDSDGGPQDRSLGISLGRTIKVIDDDTVPPTFSDFWPQMVYDNQEFYIKCVIKDDSSGVYDDNTGRNGYGVYLLMDTDGELDLDAVEMQMEKVSGDTFRSVQPLRLTNKNLLYVVYACDNDFDNNNPKDRALGRSKGQIVQVYDDDTEGPTITGFAPKTAYRGQKVYISCLIGDPSGVYDDKTGSDGQGVYLTWKTDSDNNTLYEVQLQKDADKDSLYTTVEPITIPVQARRFYYRVFAYDNDFDNEFPGDRSQSVSDWQEITLQDSSVAFRLSNFGVAPQPFDDATYFIFQLTQPADIRIRIFTLAGEKVWDYSATLNNGPVEWKGVNTAGRRLASGIYFYQFEATHNGQKFKKRGKLAIVR